MIFTTKAAPKSTSNPLLCIGPASAGALPERCRRCQSTTAETQPKKTS